MSNMNKIYAVCTKLFVHDKQKLIDTGNDILVECARTDKIFACGMSMKDPMRFDMNKWSGKNLLGFALMDLREQLKKK